MSCSSTFPALALAAMAATATTAHAADRKRWRAAQSAWIRWRTAQCDSDSATVAGGSAREMVRWQCVTRLTRERTAALDRRLQCPEGDVACPARQP
jgi:uncharacterized protein YecT (DUF1311 family)